VPIRGQTVQTIRRVESQKILNGARLFATAALVAAVVRTPRVAPGLPNGATIPPIFRTTSPWTWLAAVVVALVFYRFADEKRVARVPRWALDLGFFIVTVLAIRHVTRVGLGDVPVIQDETAYDLLARRLAHGPAVPTSSPMAEMERIRFIVDDGRRNYPLFQPGWPALLAIFWRMHIPAWGPACATGAFVVATSRLADRLYGRLAGILAGLALLGSAFVLLLGASFFAHAWAAALFVACIEGIVAAGENRSARAALFAGACAAWLFVTRMPTALGVAIVGVAAGLAFVRRDRRKLIVVFAVVAALGPLAQMAWNRATTGHAFELPQDRYFALTEPNPTR
jgi:hypothetical protein